MSRVPEEYADFSYQNSPWQELVEPEPYFDWEEARQFERERIIEEATIELDRLLMPGWGFLFAMDENASDEQIAELKEIERKHFEEHRSEIQRLKGIIYA